MYRHVQSAGFVTRPTIEVSVSSFTPNPSASRYTINDMYIHIHTYIDIEIYIHKYIYIYIYICIYTYIHTYNIYKCINKHDYVLFMVASGPIDHAALSCDITNTRTHTGTNRAAPIGGLRERMRRQTLKCPPEIVLHQHIFNMKQLADFIAMADLHTRT
jgi:hypothetical protein